MKVYDYNIVKFDFFNTAVADILRAIDGGSLMGSFVLSFCCIDYMGVAMNPFKERNSPDDFRQFVRDWMGMVNQRYRVLDNHLWVARNSLIHTYGESKAMKESGLNFSFSHEHPEYHLREIEEPKPTLWLNLPDFVAELIAAIEMFFRSTSSNEQVLAKWYGKLMIIQGAEAYFERLDILQRKRPLHRRSSRYLAILDSEPPPAVDQIRNQIANELAGKLGNGS